MDNAAFKERVLSTAAHMQCQIIRDVCILSFWRQGLYCNTTESIFGMVLLFYLKQLCQINTLGLRRGNYQPYQFVDQRLYQASGIQPTGTPPQFSQVILTSTDWLVMYLQLSMYITVKPHLHSSTCVIYTISFHFHFHFHPILLSLESTCSSRAEFK